MNRWRLAAFVPDPIDADDTVERVQALEAYYNPLGLFASVLIVHPRHRGSRSLGSLLAIRGRWRSAARLIRAYRPHVARAFAGYWPARMAALAVPPQIPLVVSVHDLNPALIDPAIGAADEAWGVSRSACRLAAGLVGEDRVRFHPDGIDCERFTPAAASAECREWRELHPGRRMVLFVGRLSPEKNLETLLRAMRHLPADVRLVVIGSGPRAAYRDLARQIDVGDRCDFIDRVPNHQMPGWYAGCDVFCVPSFREGYGLVFNEAAAAQAAIVTSDRPAMNERFTHRVDAWLVGHPGDASALAQALAQVLADPELRLRLGRAARAVALRDDFSEHQGRERDLYCDLVQRAAQPLRPSGPRLGGLRHRRWLLRAVLQESLPSGLRPWLRTALRGAPDAKPPGDPFSTGDRAQSEFA